MKFDTDAFISYAHLDNVELVEGRKGWVANLHRALEVRLGQLLGKQPHIWRDPKLSGNDFFEETLVERLSRVAALVTVLSPRYVRSEWTRRELTEFWKAAEQQGGVRLREKSRIFKIVKTPVPQEMHPPELRSLLGYEFFTIHPETGRVRELDEIFGAEAQKEFWIRLDDLAYDLCRLLETVEGAISPGEGAGRCIFLAETTSDLREQREAIKRDLQQHDYTVLPAMPLPLTESELTSSLMEDLARCEMSIHLVGKNYSLVPEGGVDSLVEIQNEFAITRAEKGKFSRLLWIPSSLETQDERQRKVIERLRMDTRLHEGTDLLEGSLEDLRTIYQERLKKMSEPEPSKEKTMSHSAASRGLVYLIYDQRDVEAMPPWMDFLFQQGFDVVRPVFEGDQAEIREYHEDNLRTCDGSLILYGRSGELWLRRKLREIQKSAAYRAKRAPTVGISLLPPKTVEKESLRTHEAMVIPQTDGFSAEALVPFISRLAS